MLLNYYKFNFNKEVLYIIKKYFKIYIPKYASSFWNARISGNLYIGINDLGFIKGIPFQSELSIELLNQINQKIIMKYLDAKYINFINIELIKINKPEEPNEKRSFSLATLGKKSKIFLHNEPKWKYVIDTLETQLQIQIRTSDNINQNTFWFLETNKGINLRDVYFINQQKLEITKKLLLIDNRIKDIELIINSINDDTYCIVFNYFYDTYDTLLSKIRFLSESNRYILDNFFYETPQLPVRKDSEGNHCTTCEEFSIDDLVLSPATLESEYLTNNLWDFYSDSTNITIQKPVFFQRSTKIEINSSIIYPSLTPVSFLEQKLSIAAF